MLYDGGQTSGGVPVEASGGDGDKICPHPTAVFTQRSMHTMAKPARTVRTRAMLLLLLLLLLSHALHMAHQVLGGVIIATKYCTSPATILIRMFCLSCRAAREAAQSSAVQVLRCTDLQADPTRGQKCQGDLRKACLSRPSSVQATRVSMSA